MTIEEKKEETNLEAEKVEESLRDFIGRVLNYILFQEDFLNIVY